MTAFEEFGVLHEIALAVEELEWSLPTDIQAEAIPAILGGGDVLMAAETGSGKTGAFCLPILQIVWEVVRDIQSGKVSKATVQATNTVSTKWGMNMYDRDKELAIDPEGLTCQSRDQQAWQGCRANRGFVNKGKYYFEAVVTDEGLCRVGWSTGKAALDLGNDKFGYGYGGTGKKSWNKQFDSYGEPYGKDDIIGCYLDLDAGNVSFAKNNNYFDVTYNIDPSIRRSPFFPAVVLKNAEMKFNFGDQPFKYPPDEFGYVGCSQAKGDTVVISSASGSFQNTAPLMPPPNAPMAIIIEPTRELAEQALNEIRRFKKHLREPTIGESLLVGGGNARDQRDALMQGVDIVVGTPGRLQDLVDSGDLLLSHVRFFVLDEADGLLSQGHEKLINSFHGKIPQVTADGKRLQMIVCSATLHNFDVKKMADRLMKFPTWIDLKGQDSVPDTVHHVVIPVDPNSDQSWRSLKRHINTDGVHAKDRVGSNSNSKDGLSEAVKILKGEYVLEAVRKFKMEQCLIFCRTKLDCDNLEQYLQNIDKNLSCVCLHSDRKPEERQRNLETFKAGKVRFLICTDVAARGLDIRGMPFVIQMTLSDEVANYIHRIGRVGRAERMGLAISFAATVPEKVWYHTCPGRGQNCYNTRLTTEGGCCKWYDERGILGEVEEHLGVTVPQVDRQMSIPIDEFEGRVTYGQKRQATGTGYKDHVGLLQATVSELAELEKRAQTSFLKMRYLNQTSASS